MSNKSIAKFRKKNKVLELLEQQRLEREEYEQRNHSISKLRQDIGGKLDLNAIEKEAKAALKKPLNKSAICEKIKPIGVKAKSELKSEKKFSENDGTIVKVGGIFSDQGDADQMVFAYERANRRLMDTNFFKKQKTGNDDNLVTYIENAQEIGRILIKKDESNNASDTNKQFTDLIAKYDNTETVPNLKTFWNNIVYNRETYIVASLLRIARALRVEKELSSNQYNELSINIMDEFYRFDLELQVLKDTFSLNELNSVRIDLPTLPENVETVTVDVDSIDDNVQNQLRIRASAINEERNQRNVIYYNDNPKLPATDDSKSSYSKHLKYLILDREQSISFYRNIYQMQRKAKELEDEMSFLDECINDDSLRSRIILQLITEIKSLTTEINNVET